MVETGIFGRRPDDPSLDFMRRNGLAEQMPLHLLASRALDLRQLLLAFDALGGRHHAKTRRQVGDGPDDRLTVFPADDLLHEAPVDLDLVEREAAQIVERAVAGAKIVEREPHPERADLVQQVDIGMVLAQDYIFGDFHLQSMRLHAGRGETMNDRGQQVGTAHLRR